MDGEGGAVGLETDFECLPEPAPVEVPQAGEPTQIDWMPEPRPAPRASDADADHPFGPAAPLREIEHEARHRWVAPLVAGRDVLYIGDRGVSGLDEMDAHSLVGVDAGDLAALPHDDAAFDLVICFGGVEHATNPDAALEELRRVLRTDGILAIGTRRRGSSGGRDVDPGHAIPGGLERALRDRFANVRIERQRTQLASTIADDGLPGSGDAASGPILEFQGLGEERPGGESCGCQAASAGAGAAPAARARAPRPAGRVQIFGDFIA